MTTEYRKQTLLLWALFDAENCCFSGISVIMSDDKLVKTVLLGSVDEIRQRGRPPKKCTDNITQWTDLYVLYVLKTTILNTLVTMTMTSDVENSKN